jgi:hypothetical protein
VAWATTLQEKRYRFSSIATAEGDAKALLLLPLSGSASLDAFLNERTAQEATG